MPLLDAALAFAVTMFVLATVVTKIVDLIHQFFEFAPEFLKTWFADRAKFFEQMLDDFLTKELSKITAREIKMGETVALEMGREALQEITASIADGPTPTNLSNPDLIDKLKQTKLGEKLLTELDVKAAPVFDEISRRYAAIEKEYTEIFRQRARLCAMIVALVLAFALNIDSINMLGSYLNDPALSAVVAAKADKAVADYEAEVAKIQLDAAAPGSEAKFRASENTLRDELDELASGTFPFGWSHFPYGAMPPKLWTHVDTELDVKLMHGSWKLWVWWLMGIFLTAGFAGLGAPFWHDVVRNMAQMASAGSRPRPPPPTPVVPVAPTAPVAPAAAAEPNETPSGSSA